MAQEIADSKLIDTWSSDGLKVKPDISKIIEGWQLGEQPPHEYMNWLQNTFGSKLNHILKNGVAGWNNETPYLAGSSVQHTGNVWLCKTTNTNSEPTDANANWKRIITVESLTTVFGGYVKQSANLSDLTNATTARTNLGLGTAATKNIGESSGNVMEVGAFGIGGPLDLRGTIYTTGTPADLYGKGYVIGFTDGSQLSPPIGGLNNYGTLEVKVPYTDESAVIAYSRSFTIRDRVFIQQAVDANTWGAWHELISTGNNQTIAGVKTFSSSPIVPTPTTGTQAVNKNYVDNIIALPIGTILNAYTIFNNCVVAFGGEFNRADYPKLWAYLEANPTLVKTQAQWTTENTTNGMCGYFSDGNGTTTFRVPNLDKAFLRPDSRTAGSYQGDAIRNIEGTINGGGNSFSWSSVSTVTGAFDTTGVETGGYSNAGSIGSIKKTLFFKASNVVPTSTENRPKNIAVLPLIVAK